MIPFHLMLNHAVRIGMRCVTILAFIAFMVLISSGHHG